MNNKKELISQEEKKDEDNIMNDERIYDLSLKKVSYIRDPRNNNGINIYECLEYLKESICKYFNKNNLKTLIIQTPLNFMNVFRPCCIMIRKNKDNEMVQIKAVTNNLQTFPFNKKYSTRHPIETMLREFNMFKQLPGMDTYEIECDPYCDMYDEIFSILKSEYYKSLPEYYIDSIEQYFRIIYESTEYEDVHIPTPEYSVGIVTGATLLQSINTPEEKQNIEPNNKRFEDVSDDINDDRYRIFVKKAGEIQNTNYPLFIRAEDNRKIFNYKCLRELITNASDVLIEFSYGILSSMTGIYKPYEIRILETSIRCCKKVNPDTESQDPVQNLIYLHVKDYDKLNHISITINK